MAAILASLRRHRSFLVAFATGAAVALAIAALVVTLTGGFSNSSAASQASDVIEQNYFKPVRGSLLDNSAIDGMTSELRKRYGDKFSHYLDPHQLREFDSATSGRFSGVGLTVTSVKRGLHVASVLPDTPAKRAGIEEGDVVVAVDGRSIANIPEQVAVARIKGPPGTPVTLRVVPGTGGKARNVRLERASVQLPVALGKMKHAGTSKVAYVRFVTFSAGAHGELSSTIERLYRQGAQGLVLDLRGNGGGLLDEAVLSASLFLKQGDLVVSTDSRTMGHREYDAVGNPLEAHPIVVLINHDTASSAEILASALEDHHVATTIGTRSYGKGTFQKVIRLAAGGALDLTVGKYFTADGTSLAGKGIPPDIPAPDDPQTHRDEGLQKALSVLGETIAVENR
jgi:carboxyl-terminal processing protease